MKHALAQANAAIMNGCLTDPRMQGMVSQIEAINQLAATHPGFLKRVSPSEEQELIPISHYLQGADLDRIFFNMSLWKDLASLRSFTYETIHRRLISDKKDWIQAQARPSFVLWWQPIDQTLTIELAAEKLSALSAEGATAKAFDFKSPFPPPQKPLHP